MDYNYGYYNLRLNISLSNIFSIILIDLIFIKGIKIIKICKQSNLH
mgnify:CR=1 FL=1